MVPNDIDPTVGVAKCEWCKGVNSFGIGITPSSFADSCTSQKESTVVRIKLIIVVLCGLSMVYEARGPSHGTSSTALLGLASRRRVPSVWLQLELLC